MLKSLGRRAESFKQLYSPASQENVESVKEACFDIQFLLVTFFTTAVTFMRGGEDKMQHCRHYLEDQARVYGLADVT